MRITRSDFRRVKCAGIPRVFFARDCSKTREIFRPLSIPIRRPRARSVRDADFVRRGKRFLVESRLRSRTHDAARDGLVKEPLQGANEMAMKKAKKAAKKPAKKTAAKKKK